MKTQSIGLGALVGGLLTVPMVAVMYLADKWLNLSFAPYDIFDWIARILPGPVVTFGIDCWQSAQVGQIRTREDYYCEELRGSSLRVLL